MTDSFTPVILAGGFGTRLKTVIPSLPKVLSPVNDRPFLSYLLDQLIDANMETVILCTGYLGNLIEEYFGSSYRGLIIQYSREFQPLGTGGAIGNVLPLVSSRSVLVMNGDSYCNVDLRTYLNWVDANRYSASMILTSVYDTSRYGKVVVDQYGQILEFKEKEQKTEAGLINAGIYSIDKNLLNAIPTNRFYSLETSFLPFILAKGLFGFIQDNEFIDIGTPTSYFSAKKFFLKIERK